MSENKRQTLSQKLEAAERARRKAQKELGEARVRVDEMAATIAALNRDKRRLEAELLPETLINLKRN